jgi:hypothetical protein
MAHEMTGLHVFDTYAGVLAGWPSPETVVNGAREKAEGLRKWEGPAPIHIVEPRRVTSHPATVAGRQPALIPRWTYMALLEGPPKDAKMHGSHILLVWFSDSRPGERVELPDVDVAALAEDFKF